MSRKKLGNGGIDRISSLPLHILHHIMSLLPLEDVTRTGALSKTWNRIWVSYPTLEFNDYLFNRRKSVRAAELFVNHVNSSLNKFCQQDVKMRKLKVTFSETTGPIAPSIISQWLKLALQKGVEEIFIRSWSGYNIVMPPLKFQFGSEKYAMFNSVKKVFLGGIILDKVTFGNLFTVCPLIEVLELYQISGLQRLHIPKVQRLAELSIDCPYNLESIDIQTESIRELTLNRVGGISPLILAINFPVLEFLRITLSRFEDGLQIRSPSLKFLELESNDVFKGLEIDTPNLCSFKYCDNGMPCVMSAPCQWDIRLLEYNKTLETSWFVDLKNVLARSTQVLDFGCEINYCHVSFSLEDVEETNLTSVPAVEKVCLTFRYRDDIVESDSNFLALLNGILWCCRPEMILVESNRKSCINFLRKQFKRKSNPLLCCSSTPVKCWRHDLKGVKKRHHARGAICFELTW